MATDSDTSISIDRLNDQIVRYLIQQDNLKFDSITSGISFSGFYLTTDLANSNEAIRNDAMYNIGNSLPSWSSSYTPSGDFITSYSIFLDNLVPSDLSSLKKDAYQKARDAKLAVQERLLDILKKEVPGSRSVSAVAIALLKQYELAEKAANTILESSPTINAVTSMLGSFLTDGNTAKSRGGTSAVDLVTAMGMVSFTAGARKLTGANAYNMPVNTYPPSPQNSYSPRFSIQGLDAALGSWRKNAAENKFPIKLKASDANPDQTWGLGSFLPAGTFNTMKDALQLVILGEGGNRSPVSPAEEIPAGAYTARAKFSGLGAFPIMPGIWFQKDFFEQTQYELLADAPDFFSKTGSLALIPTKVILAYNFSLEIRLPPEKYNSLKNVISTRSTNSVLGLALGAAQLILSGPQKNAAITFPNTIPSTIEIKALNTDVPNLLGVVSEKTKNTVSANLLL